MIVYTLVGSLLMLVKVATVILVAQDTGEPSIAELRANLLDRQPGVDLLLLRRRLLGQDAGLPDSRLDAGCRAAPPPVLVLLSGVLAKVGAYGFLRIVLPIYPDATVTFQEVVMVIAVASILYGSVMAFTQTNVRLVAGYSSVAQLGFITLGIFSLRSDGADGAVLQMVNHGFVVAAIFLIIALLYERARPRT